MLQLIFNESINNCIFPGYVVGSVEETAKMMLCATSTDDGVLTVERREIRVVPAFLKIADEAFSNALDEACKGHGVRSIKITVTESTVTVWNDGDGIPCGMHSKQKDMPIPQVAFGVLSTSSNYGEGDRTVAGLNGLGIKLANVFSRRFEVKVRHAATGDTYHQTWSDQMGVASDFAVKRGSKPVAGYVSVSFDAIDILLPSGITEGIRASLLHRAMEVALAAPKGVRVVFNDVVIKCESLKKYMRMIVGDVFMETDEADPNWLVGVAYTAARPANGAQTYSMANGVSTPDGGKHVTHVLGHLMAKLLPVIKAKTACKSTNVTPQSIHKYATYFIVARVNGPDFKGQTKDALEACKWLSEYRPSDSIVKKIAASEIATAAIGDAQEKVNSKLARVTDGKKTATITGIENFYDAAWAGTAKSKQAKLILTEGNSALAFAIVARSVWGTDKVGCFPLKGKPINPRGKSAEAVMGNKEFANIKKILGLKNDVDSADNLRYGSVVILSDADTGGGVPPPHAPMSFGKRHSPCHPCQSESAVAMSPCYLPC